jgi:zinc ribbon protein
MRCPSCGTENAPDSRFCGGCGARLHASEPPRDKPVLAPTQKISDDAPMPPQRPSTAPPPPSPPPSIPPSVGLSGPRSQPNVQAVQRQPSVPPSMPPPAYAPPPPSAPRAAIPAPPAMVSRGSMSMPIRARRPWGLIAVVLVIDLGLAGAGAWMLSEGLGSSSQPAPVKGPQK